MNLSLPKESKYSTGAVAAPPRIHDQDQALVWSWSLYRIDLKYKIEEELKTKVQMLNSTILFLQIFIFGVHYYGELLYIYCNKYQK
jgi:hypothetical protein